jgi:hypothetical protein
VFNTSHAKKIGLFHVNLLKRAGAGHDCAAAVEPTPMASSQCFPAGRADRGHFAPGLFAAQPIRLA